MLNVIQTFVILSVLSKSIYMKFIDLAAQRYSVRNYDKRPVEQEKLMYILEAARIAPSAVNFQPWQFIVVTDPDLLNSIQGIYPRKWLHTTPLMIVALGDHKLAWHRKPDGKDYTDIDVAIAIDHMMLAATEQNLGTCWICNFDLQKCCELFNLPEHLEPIAMISIGYPIDESKPDKKRKPIDELVHWNKLTE
jgi:nitroreductase